MAPKKSKETKQPETKKATKQVEYIQDPPITMENFELLAKKYRPLMWKHIRLVYNMHNKGVELPDLEQEALLALFKSIECFDPERKVYFPVYLSKAILNKLLCYCRNFLPHFYKKDPENIGKFKRIKVFVDTLDSDKQEYKF